MVDILPIRVLTDTDIPFFGSLNVLLGKLSRAGLPAASGFVITAPGLKLKTTLEHFDFESKEVFTQSLTMVKKEIAKIPVPDILLKESGKKKDFFLQDRKIKGVKVLWQHLLNLWFDEIKVKLWNNGFYAGITEGLEPKVVVFISKVESIVFSFQDPFEDDVKIQIKNGHLNENDFKKIIELTRAADKKLFLPHEYKWIVDKEVKLAEIKPYTPVIETMPTAPIVSVSRGTPSVAKSAVKVFFDLSSGFTIEKNIDGVFIAAEKIFDLNKPTETFDDMVLKLVESASSFPDSPVFFKLADKHSLRLPDGSFKSEGMGKVRGTLRLIHQKSLLDPMTAALDFVRHKKGLTNVHIVIPFVRGVNELLQIKRELAVKKLMRKNSLKMWLELAVPENILNLENYLVAGIDGVVLNLDELIAHLNGFDPSEGELALYKNEVEGLIKFLEDGIRLLHKSKIPFIAYGSLTFYPKVLEFLAEKGVWGVVAERYEAHSAHDLLHQVERRMILRRS